MTHADLDQLAQSFLEHHRDAGPAALARWVTARGLTAEEAREVAARVRRARIVKATERGLRNAERAEHAARAGGERRR